MVKCGFRYNELAGKNWLQYSFSIWRDVRKNDEEKRLKHPAMFPIQLAARIIEIFSKRKGVVLDPFMGTGSAILAAYEKQRVGIGIELSKEYCLIAEKRVENIREQDDKEILIEPRIHNTDARMLGEYISPSSVDLCLTSPPYWDILNMNRSADGKKQVNYSDQSADLGNIANYQRFLDELQDVFVKVYQVLRQGGHCVIVLMDIRKKDVFYPFHSDVADRMRKIGYSFEDIVIWDRQHEYNNMRPLGYPYVFRVNKVHEYILIFKKK